VAVNPIVARQSPDIVLIEDEFEQCTGSEVSHNVQRGDPVIQNRSSIARVYLNGVRTTQTTQTTVSLGSEEWHRPVIARFDQVVCCVTQFHL